jgi:para-nitrobenzyl esterase
VSRASGAAYFYLFSRSLPTPGGDRLGAFHGAETAYVMNNLALETCVPRDSHDQELADVMSDYWVQFASTGDPNGGDRPVWPLYTPDSEKYLELGSSIGTGTGIRPEACELFDELQMRRLGGE